MSKDKFAPSRPNGLSDSEVLAMVIGSASPGDVIEYGAIAKALGADSDREFGTKDVQAAVNRSERKIATELSRALMNVRRVGYKIALASDHQRIAGRKKDKAGSQLKRGLMILQHVDWAAMDSNTRQAHEGQLMVVSALHQAMKGMDTRLRKIEDAIRDCNLPK